MIGKKEAGQGTIELAALMPVVLIVAVIAVNACTFFSECAVFDRIARQAIRAQATTPAYGQGADTGRAKVEQELAGAFCKGNESVSVAVESAGGECVRYRATIYFRATLFGLGLKEEVFGVSLPPMKHEVSLVVDPYNPGVVM